MLDKVHEKPFVVQSSFQSIVNLNFQKKKVNYCFLSQRIDNRIVIFRNIQCFCRIQIFYYHIIQCVNDEFSILLICSKDLYSIRKCVYNQQYYKQIKNNKFRLFELLLKCARFRSSFSSQLKFSLLYNSIRYRRIFDIIKLLKRFIIELQMNFLCMYFED